jgi:hypothetical protein
LSLPHSISWLPGGDGAQFVRTEAGVLVFNRGVIYPWRCRLRTMFPR